MNAPSISVIIPTHRNRGFLPETLESVRAQTLAPVEILVIDDGSTDDTPQALEALARQHPSLRVHRQPNGGVARARNTGIRLARGEFIALLDDDDLWVSDKLAWQGAFLQEHPSVGAVAGRARIYHHRLGLEAPLPGPTGPLTLEHMLRENRLLSPGQTLIRRAVFERLGGFDETMPGTDDYDFWMRCVRGPGLWMDERVSLHYRVHPTATSSSAPLMLAGALRVVRRHTRHLPRAERKRLCEEALSAHFLHHRHRMIRDTKRRLRQGPFRREALAALACTFRYAVACHRTPGFLSALVREFLPDRFKRKP